VEWLAAPGGGVSKVVSWALSIAGLSCLAVALWTSD
jgi:hypothetical protein